MSDFDFGFTLVDEDELEVAQKLETTKDNKYINAR